MELVHPLADQYAAAHTTAVDDLLQEIIAYTETNHPKHHMLSGAVQGKMLEWLSCLTKPQFILEIGTFTGFSALCLAKGLAPNGELHTIELRDEDAAIAQSFFDKSSFTNQIKLHVGNALEILPTLDITWDLVFIDADKVSYSNYYDLILPKIRKDGIIIVDNVFFHGDVLVAPIKGKNAIAVKAFNEKIKNDRRIEKLMLTIRDGLYLLRKL